MPKFREFDPFNPVPLNRPTRWRHALRAVQFAGVAAVGLFLLDTYDRAATMVAGHIGVKMSAEMHTTTVPTEVVDRSPLWSGLPTQ